MSASGVVSRSFVRPPAYAPLRVGYRIYYIYIYIYIRSVVLVTDFFFISADLHTFAGFRCARCPRPRRRLK